MEEEDDFNVEGLAKLRAQQAAEKEKALQKAMEEDPALREIMLESRAVQQDTRISTENSVRILKQTMVVADETSNTLLQQGEQLDRIDEKAQEADANATDSYKSSKDLHKYKGFLPISLTNAFKGGDKRGKDAELAKANKKLDQEEVRLQRLEARTGPSMASAGAAAGAAYEDETEREIDRNLDDISAGLDHLTQQAVAMNTELKRQNVTIKRIEATTEHTDYTLNSANRKISEFL